MAAPNQTTPGQETIFSDDLVVSDSSGDSSMFNDNDDEVDVTTTTPGMATVTKGMTTPGELESNGATPGQQMMEPGAVTFIAAPGEQDASTRGGTMYPDLPDEQDEADPNSPIYVYNKEEAYINSIHTAISALQREIYQSEEERKQSELSIERQFADIIEQLLSKKSECVLKMQQFYDEQKQTSLDRIQELKIELNEKQTELQIDREKQRQKEEELRREEEEKAAHAAEFERQQQEQQQQQTSNEDGAPAMRRLSVIGNILKENAKKASNLALEKYEQWKQSQDKDDGVAQQAQYDKHDKIRLFVPRKELAKLIGTDIRLTTEWWNSFQLNHIVYNTHDSDLWRTSSINGGWYNAFGSIKIRKSQRKRWNIKICERVKPNDRRTGKQKPADIVVGVIESDRIQPQNSKPVGFWCKPFDGFGFYGWNGKIFHKKSRGKVYGQPFYAGSTVGIELDLVMTPGMDLQKKTEAKTHLKSSTVNILDMGIHGGVVKFYVDDVDLGIAFYDLDLDKEYSLAVSLNNDAYNLQLID